jgi:membrane-associated protease RseP (regulator of RpoE activity)
VSYALGVLFFSFALLLSVMLHEAGHFATAKAFGMKASRFFVGFGPTLWSFTRGETEYGVKALPAGGFVKIEGMTALEELAPGDEDRAFYKQPPGRRTIVLAAGSTVHFIIAILLVFGIIAITHSDPIHGGPTTTIAAVEKCVPLSASESACTSKDPKAPANGKLLAGDKVVAINGVPVTSYAMLGPLLQANPGTAHTVTIVRDGQRKVVSLTTVPVKEGRKTVGKVGFEPVFAANHVSFAASFGQTFSTLGDFVTSTGAAIKGIPHEIAGIVQGQPRDPQGAASVVDVARVSGQISSSGASFSQILAALLLIVAELNLFVGIFNLLPLLPLDGGHIAILAFEETRSRIARAFGWRDPGRVDIMKVMPLTYAVVAAFVGLSLILIYAGIANPIRLQ